ncbi:O-antigen ligase like membrane protein [Myroides sp. A21]|uniref:O-antigen ligase family protein n=1 Tax=Myroides sp. A21 TaxID=1583100 RepID=UPI00058644B9|nr:O-antigen ligase family protein [Myroides sp. A21]AJA70392.1 O-antigen ligase like membrane protein [Myroides sp. A21]
MPLRINRYFILICFLLMVFFNPFAAGHRLAILGLFLLFLLLPSVVIKSIDFNSIAIFTFSLLYYFFEGVSPYYTESWTFNIFFVFLPVLFYLLGKVLCRYYMQNNKINLLFKYLVIMLCLFSLVPIISVLEQINKFTFVDGERSMYLIWSRSYLLSATVLGNFMIFTIGMSSLLLIDNSSIKLSRVLKYLIFIFSVLSLICIIRLGNRTQLVTFVFTFIVLSYFSMKNNNRVNRKKFYRKVFVIFILTVIGSKFINITNDFFYFYQDRMDSSNTGVFSAGGRMVKWMNSFEYIFEYPFGWSLSLTGYAHNIWLDIGRVAGFFSFIAFLFVTFLNIRDLAFLVNYNKNYKEIYYLLIIVFLNLYLLFFMEPVIEGMFLSFLLFFLFWGILKSYNQYGSK